MVVDIEYCVYLIKMVCSTKLLTQFTTPLHQKWPHFFTSPYIVDPFINNDASPPPHKLAAGHE